MKLGFLASSEGSNMQSIIDACADGRIGAAPAILICNNPKANATNRAHAAGLAVSVLNRKTHPTPESLDEAIRDTLEIAGVDLVILAGYMRKIGPLTLSAFRNRILNIHPSLLPKFGGKGMYGLRVHEAIIESGETHTGATVHLIDGEYDRGPILQQATTSVQSGETAESLQTRVLQIEHSLYPDTVAKVVRGDIKLPA